jgi:rhodanese-related sulfurtransferase
MEHAGLKNIFALKGGLLAWENANYPIVKDISPGG